jgi:Spy/CpxP family protein refolding chaperone
MLVRFLLAAVLASGLALAQRGGGGGLGRDEGGIANTAGIAGGRAQVRSLTREETLFDKLKLNKEQREEAARILSTAMEKAAPTRDLLTKGRIAIANAITGSASDEDLKAVLDAFTAANATMTGIEAEAFGKLYALLTPNQRSKAPQRFELMTGMFAGGGSGGGRMGDGSGRGRGGQGRGEGRR